MSYLYLILAFILNGSANVLLKIASSKGLDLDIYNFKSFLINNFYLFSGLILFAMNVVFYTLALKNLNISFAYPIMVTMSFLIIGAFAVLYFGEKLSNFQILGYAFIIIGIILATSTQK